MKITDYAKESEHIIAFIKDYYQKNNLKGIVIGISGGKDSAVTTALFAKAIGPENILGVTLPCHSNSADAEDAMLIGKHFGIEMVNVDLTETFDNLALNVAKLGNFTESELENSNINLKPRLRTATLYYLAALYSNLKGGTYIVAGNGNKCEGYVGYFTKGGDNLADIKLLEDLTVSEVIGLGRYLGVPDKIISKAPSDGLSNQTDEEKLGVKYADIEKYMAGEEVDTLTRKRIEVLHNNSIHKFHTPSYHK